MHADAFVILSAGVMLHLLRHRATATELCGWKVDEIPHTWPCLASDTCDGVHLEVGRRSHASCKLLCRLNVDTHTGPPGHSCRIVDAQGQNKAYDILNQP